MFDRVSRSWELAKASASVLRSDKELLVFPVLSGLAAMIVAATFLVPAFAMKVFDGDAGVGSFVLGFLFYLCQYFVIFFFNAALVAAAMIRLEGGDPTVADGLRAARERIGPILGYAAIAATVGMLLQAMKNKDNNFVVRMVGSLLGVAWTMASFLVVPVLVMQNVGPIDAIKRSVELLKRTWGENAIGNVGIGLVFGLVTVLLVVVAAVLVFLAASVSGALAVTVAVFAVLALVTLGIIQSALSGVYSAALYRYATVGEAPAGFSGTGLQTAFQPR
jgi:hypothetical protein